MQNRNAFAEILVRRFVRANRIPAVLPPPTSPATNSGQRKSDPALNAFIESVNSEVRLARYANRTPQHGILAIFQFARAMIVLLFVVFTLATQAAVREV